MATISTALPNPLEPPSFDAVSRSAEGGVDAPTRSGLAALAPVVRQICRAHIPRDACGAALSALAAFSAADRGAILLHNQGASYSEQHASTWRVEIAVGHWDVGELPHTVLAIAVEADTLRAPRHTREWMALPFASEAGDAGVVILSHTARFEALRAVSPLLLEPLQLVLDQLARAAGWVPTELAVRAPNDVYGALRQIQQVGGRSNTPTTVLVVRLDALPELRQRLGSAAAEHLARHVAKSIGNACRSTDVVRTLSGDELVVALSATPMAGGARVADALCQRIRTIAVEVDGVELATTASIGVAPTELGVINPRLTVSQAKRAADDAHEAGGDRAKLAVIAVADPPQ